MKFNAPVNWLSANKKPVFEHFVFLKMDHLTCKKEINNTVAYFYE